MATAQGFYNRLWLRYILGKK